MDKNRITVNGSERALPDPATLQGLLADVGCAPDTVVVEHNGNIVPAGSFDQVPLAAGDIVEIVRFVGGG